MSIIGITNQKFGCMEEIVFFDNNSTTATDPRVVEAMLPYLTKSYANPASSHSFGIQVSKKIDAAKSSIADLINCDPSELIFTSGATESINLALKGFALSNQHKGKHIISVLTEHKATLDTLNYLETIGFEVTYLQVNQSGQLDLNELQKQIRKDTILLSVMWVNNEIGTIHPLAEIAQITKDSNVAFFTDATQAVGKLSVDLSTSNIDMAAFSGHKIYGPKGIGVLYIRNLRKAKSQISPLIHGGGHQYGLRSGTLNVPAIIGLGEACKIASKEMAVDEGRIMKLRDTLESALIQIPGSSLNGLSLNRMYNLSNICFEGVDANLLIGQLQNIAVSNGSACTSSIVEPSHVLKAIGLNDQDALSSIRFSLGKYNTLEEVNFVIASTKKIVQITSPANA
jgi:cysteine desulfurase